jgi:hypothetical protein
LKLNGTCQLLVFADGVNIFDKSIQKNTESLLVASNDFDLEINGEKTTYTVISHECTTKSQHKGR